MSENGLNQICDAYQLDDEKLEYAIQRELLRRRKAKDPMHALIGSLFGAQREFVMSPNHMKAAICSRRAGKSHGLAAYLYICGRIRPGSTQLYLGLTRDAAKRIFWPKIKEMNEQFGLALRLTESDLTAVIPETGSPIRLYGADQERIVNRLRGDAYGAVAIDEAQSYGSNLGYLIDEVLEPATLDFSGQIAMCGTPGPVPTGVFYDATTGDDEYEVHRWTMHENPFIENPDEFIDRLCKRRGWDRDHPTILREYFGQWAFDPDALVYKFTRERNIGEPDNRYPLEYAVGVDLGYNDHFAIVVIAWNATASRAYIVHAESHSKKLPEFWAQRIMEVQEEYNPVVTAVDAGALGKPIVEEMKKRFGIPLTAAEKTEKFAMIELMNSEFTSGRLFVSPHLRNLIDQYLILKKDDKGREDQSLRNDLCIAENTIVKTAAGNKLIQNCTRCDYVLTRKGFKKVLANHSNGIKKVGKLTLENGMTLRCTENHQIATENGFCLAGDLKKGDLVWVKALKSNTMDINGTYTQRANFHLCEDIFIESSKINHGLLKWSRFIGTSIKKKSEKFIKDIMYITKMATLTIMISQISNLSKAISIIAFIMNGKENGIIHEDLKSYWKKIESLQKYGTPQKRAEIGTQSIGKRLWDKLCKKTRLLFALFAEKTSWLRRCQNQRPYVATSAMLKSDEILASITSKKSVSFAERCFVPTNTEKLGFALVPVRQAIQIEIENVRVYDLTIQDCHEYVANGIVVHNCDAALYAYRHSRHIWSAPDPVEPLPGSTNWWQKQEHEFLQGVIDGETRKDTEWL